LGAGAGLSRSYHGIWPSAGGAFSAHHCSTISNNPYISQIFVIRNYTLSITQTPSFQLVTRQQAWAVSFVLAIPWCGGTGWAICRKEKGSCFYSMARGRTDRYTSRYANMDFIVLSTLTGMTVGSLTLSYDIACQWSRNFTKRITQFPAEMQLPAPILDTIKYVIPKFHIYGHGRQCQTKFSLNFLPYSARTNGEEPERWWAHINPVSMSTREMTAGARHDTIDDHAGSWNWHKITNLGERYHLLCVALTMTGFCIALPRKVSEHAVAAGLQDEGTARSSS
jgi:hypothetical protein